MILIIGKQRRIWGSPSEGRIRRVGGMLILVSQGKTSGVNQEVADEKQYSYIFCLHCLIASSRSLRKPTQSDERTQNCPDIGVIVWRGIIISNHKFNTNTGTVQQTGCY